jgi:hypothetical protein
VLDSLRSGAADRVEDVPAPASGSRRVWLAGGLGLALAAGVLLVVGLERIVDRDADAARSAELAAMQLAGARAVESAVAGTRTGSARASSSAEPPSPAAGVAGPELVQPIPVDPEKPLGPRSEVRARRAEDTLGEELALLVRARTAVQAGEPRRGRRLLDEHQRRYPKSRLDEERTLLSVQARCLSGEKRGARRLAAEFARKRPGSAFVGPVTNACP